MAARGRSCETCDHWHADELAGSAWASTGRLPGLCRMKAPNGTPPWPATMSDYWCGEWIEPPQPEVPPDTALGQQSSLGRYGRGEA